MFVEDGEVIYSKSEKRNIVDKNIKAYIFHHTNNKNESVRNTNLMRTYLYLYLLFFKGENKWSDEREYRFAFCVEKEYAKRIIKKKKKDNKVTPYISLSLHDKEIEHPFEEIVIGPKNDYKNNKNALYNFLGSKSYYNKLKKNIFKSDILIKKEKK